MKLSVPEYSSRMIKSLPSFYLTEDTKHDNVLERYLISVFVGGSEDILSSINHTEDFVDPYKCPTEDLPHLFKSWGMSYEPTLAENYQRKLIANLGEIYRRKGSYSCVKYLVRSITGRDCDVIYQKLENGDRRVDVTLISNSLSDIVSGEIERATYAIQKILPQFLPFYLIPHISFSSPRSILEFDVRNKGFRVAERVLNDFTFKGLSNIFVNSDFSNATENWGSSEGHTLTTSNVKKDGANCLASTSTSGSYFYQDVSVHYKDIYSAKAYFMCPTHQAEDITVKMLITFFREDGTVIHSTLNAQTSLVAKEKWCIVKRDIYIDEKLCTKMRISFHCSAEGQVIYFSSPQLLRKSRVEQLHCADILSVTSTTSDCIIEWSPVMGATEYLVYSVDKSGVASLISKWSDSQRFIWNNAPLLQEGLKVLIASTNGHIISDLEVEKAVPIIQG